MKRFSRRDNTETNARVQSFLRFDEGKILRMQHSRRDPIGSHAEFSPIRGTASWEDLVARGIIPDDLDPLLTNNSVFSYLYSGYDWKEVERLKIEVKEYNRSRWLQ